MENSQRNGDITSEAHIKKMILAWLIILIVLIYAHLAGILYVENNIFDLSKRINWLLSGNIIILGCVTLFIIFPLFLTIKKSIKEIYLVNKLYEVQTKELEQSRLAVLSILEDAQKARLEAEQARDAVLRQADIVDSSEDAIIGKTLDGMITSWNKGAEKIYGYTAEDVIGQNVSKMVPDQKRKELSEIFRELHRGGKIVNLETQRLTKSGKLIDVALTISPIRNVFGELVGASSIGRDVTLLKQAENALRERERWFRSLIENSSDLLMQLDIEGRIVYASPSIKKILGYDTNERIGHSIFELVHPDDLEGISGLFHEILEKENHTVKGEARIKHKNGSWRWIEGIGHNLLHEPSIESIVINGRDSTEQKINNERLKQNEEKYRLLVETTHVIPWEADIKTFQFVYVGPQAKKILGYTADEWYTKDFWTKHIHPEDRDYALQYCLEKSKEKKDYEFEYRMISKAGNIVWFKDIVSILPEGLDHGLLRGYLIDITEQKMAEEEVKKYSVRLQESNKELEQFAFVASHDLQEPLRIISSYAHLLSQKYKGKIDDVADKYIHYVVTNVGRMQEMINSLLEYSRLGKYVESSELVNTGDICDQAISNLTIAAKRKKAKIIRNDLPVLNGHRIDFLRIFQNLINNAIKYCNKGEPLIRVSAVKNNNYWVFSIEDNGIGIEKEYTHQIFDVFKRLHTKSEYPGSGMGLAICKKIVEHNGGRIWVESEPNVGSQFYFSFPTEKESAYEYKAV